MSSQTASKIRVFQAWAADLASRCEPGEAARALQKFAEDLRFSDPVSSPALAGVERDLEASIQALESALTDGDTQGVLGLCQNAEAVLFQRNQLCKLNKGN